MASPLLTLKTQDRFRTLHAANVLNSQVPNAPAITYIATNQEPQTITHAEFLARTQHSAAALIQLGIQPRDLIIIADTQSFESIFAFWGAIWMGAIPSMLSPLTEKLDKQVYIERIGVLVEHSAAKLVLTNDDFASRVSTMGQDTSAW